MKSIECRYLSANWSILSMDYFDKIFWSRKATAYTKNQYIVNPLEAKTRFSQIFSSNTDFHA